MAEATPLSLGDITRRYRVGIAIFGIVFGLTAYIMTKRATPVWLARTEIAVPSGGSSLGDVGALLSLSQDSPLQYLRGLFESRATRQELARTATVKFKKETRVPEIDKMFAAKAMVDTSQLVLEMRHEDKEFAIGILNAATTYVRSLDEQSASQVAVKKYNAYEDSLREKIGELSKAQDALQDFTETAKTVTDPLNPFSGGTYKARLQEIQLKLGSVEKAIGSLKDQARKSARSAGSFPTDLPGATKWREVLVNLEYQLRIAETTFSPTSARVIDIKKQIEATKKQFADEVASSLRSVEQDSFPGLMELIVERESLLYQKDYLQKMSDKAPSESRLMQELMREVQIKEGVVQELRKQSEISSVEAKVKRINWAMLGDPYVVDEPINKRSFQNGVIAGLGGIVLGMAIFFMIARNRKPRRNADDF